MVTHYNPALAPPNTYKIPKCRQSCTTTPDTGMICHTCYIDYSSGTPIIEHFEQATRYSCVRCHRIMGYKVRNDQQNHHIPNRTPTEPRAMRASTSPTASMNSRPPLHRELPYAPVSPVTAVESKGRLGIKRAVSPPCTSSGRYSLNTLRRGALTSNESMLSWVRPRTRTAANPFEARYFMSDLYAFNPLRASSFTPTSSTENSSGATTPPEGASIWAPLKSGLPVVPTELFPVAKNEHGVQSVAFGEFVKKFQGRDMNQLADEPINLLDSSSFASLTRDKAIWGF